MIKKFNFSLCDEEKILDFVKSNELLYNVRHSQFRNTVRKNQLWAKLANDLNAEIEAVKKKWANMRDYFIRSQTKKTTGNPSTNSKRDEAMMFLLDTSILKRKTVTNLTTNEPGTTSLEDPEVYIDHAEISDSELELSSDVIEATDGRDPRPSPFFVIDVDGRSSNTSWTDSRRSNCDGDVETPHSSRKKRRTNEDVMTELMREFMASRKPTPVEFLPPKDKPKEPLQIFFDTIYSTVRTFPPKSIAKLKLKISQIVGEEKVALTDQDQKNKKNNTIG